jgi:uncharacterized membrane protein YeaQ/YmgE (transglycosylase-associated protein family)
MTLFSLLLLLLVAAVAGAVGQALAGSSRGGCLVNIVVGFLGAWIGMWMANSLGLPTFFVVDAGGVDFPVVWAIIGSGALVAVLGLLFGGGRRP